MRVAIWLLKYPVSEISNLRTAVSCILRGVVKRFIAYVQNKNRIVSLQKQVLRVKSYAEWDQLTKEIDQLSGKNKWKLSDLGGEESIS